MDKILQALRNHHLKIEDFRAMHYEDSSDLSITVETLDKVYDLQIHNNGTWSIAEAE